MADDTNPEAELKQLGTDLKNATDEVKRFAETAQTEIKNLGAMTTETKALADKALVDMNGMSARLTEVEQKVARKGGPQEPSNLKTLGQHVVDNVDVKGLMEAKSGQARVSIDLKDIVSGTAAWGTGVSSSTSLVIADRQPLVPFPTYKLVVRDLLIPGNTVSNSIEYPVEITNPTTTGAYVVAEGALKPQTDIQFDLKTSPVRTVATFAKASRQILDDAPMLQSYIDGRLRWGLSYREELEFLYGDGTGAHLKGIIPQATPYSAPFVPSLLSNIDTLRLMALQATLALYPASGYVMHPTDWAKIELTKDTLGEYIVGRPQGNLSQSLWGLPVVTSLAMVAGHALSGAFNMACQVFDRLALEVMVSTENSDDFVRNLITLRCEARMAIVVYVPTAFIYATLS